MSYPPQGNKADVATIDTNVTTLLNRITAARAGYLDELAAANLPTDVAANLAAIAAVNTIVTRGRPDMVWMNEGGFAPIAIRDTGNVTDLTFPSVVVSGFPSGLSIKRITVALAGCLFDTSGSENQINAASKALRIMLNGGSWGTNDIVAITFQQNALQVGGDAYRAFTIFGNTDVKSVVTADGTYDFKSEQTHRSDALTATGDTLEILDAAVVIRAWWN